MATRAEQKAAKAEKLRKEALELDQEVKAEQAEQIEDSESIDWKALCLEQYHFWDDRLGRYLRATKKNGKTSVSIEVNRDSLMIVLDIMIDQNQIDPLRYSVGDGNIYLNKVMLQPFDVVNIQHKLLKSLGGKITQREVEEACLSAAYENKFDRVEDFFVNLNPENKDTNHLENWLSEVFGAEDTIINRVIAKKFMVSAVARAMNPGCYVEGTLILYGEQAAGKSQACMYLAPFEDTYFGDFIDITNTQKATQTLKGKFIVEFSELASLNPKTVEDIKNWLTRKEDTYVAKYSNIPTNVPRQFVCIGTTNAAAPLNDPSGNRRFWVVKVGEPNIKRLREIKEELWYEALCQWEKWMQPEYRDTLGTNDPWVLTKEERQLLAVSNKEFEVPSSISDWLKQNFNSLIHDNAGYVKYSDIKNTISKMERISDSRLANILVLELGCESRRMADGSYYKYPFDTYKETVKYEAANVHHIDDGKMERLKRAEQAFMQSVEYQQIMNGE